MAVARPSTYTHSAPSLGTSFIYNHSAPSLVAGSIYNHTQVQRVNRHVLSSLGLQRAYSRAIYGEEGRLPLNDLKLIYLWLLSNESQRIIESEWGGLCFLESKWLFRPFFSPINIHFDVDNVAWVHQSVAISFNHPVPNNTWEEVAHCKSCCNESACMQRPIGTQYAWFYHAPGSGISINVGRTVTLGFSDLLKALYSHLEAGRAQASSKPSSHALVDSYQVTGHHEFFSKERRHEIVLLGHTSCATMADYAAAGVVRCGRSPWLYECESSEAGRELLRRASTCASKPHTAIAMDKGDARTARRNEEIAERIRTKCLAGGGDDRLCDLVVLNRTF